MTTNDRLQREYHTYCCKMMHAIESDPDKYKVLGFKEWKENREKIERREGIEGK